MSWLSGVPILLSIFLISTIVFAIGYAWGYHVGCEHGKRQVGDDCEPPR